MRQAECEQLDTLLKSGIPSAKDAKSYGVRSSRRNDILDCLRLARERPTVRPDFATIKLQIRLALQMGGYVCAEGPPLRKQAPLLTSPRQIANNWLCGVGIVANARSQARHFRPCHHSSGDLPGSPIPLAGATTVAFHPGRRGSRTASECSSAADRRGGAWKWRAISGSDPAAVGVLSSFADEKGTWHSSRMAKAATAYKGRSALAPSWGSRWLIQLTPHACPEQEEYNKLYDATKESLGFKRPNRKTNDLLCQRRKSIRTFLLRAGEESMHRPDAKTMEARLLREAKAGNIVCLLCSLSCIPSREIRILRPDLTCSRH